MGAGGRGSGRPRGTVGRRAELRGRRAAAGQSSGDAMRPARGRDRRRPRWSRAALVAGAAQ